MRAPWAWILLAALTAGCASPPESLWTRLPTVEPAANPYAISGEGDEVERTVPRVPDWTDAQHVRVSEALLGRTPGAKRPGDLIAFTQEGLRLRGPASQVDALARCLADRSAFAKHQLFVQTWLLRVRGSEPVRLASAERLPRTPGVWAVVRSEALVPLLEGPRQPLGELVQAPSIFALDGQETVVFVGEFAQSVQDEPAAHRGPGFLLRSTAGLSAEGKLLRLDLESQLSVFVEPADGTELSIQASTGGELRKLWIPSTRRSELRGRFTLREHEALVLACEDPAEGGPLLLVFAWDWIPRRPELERPRLRPLNPGD